MGLSKASNAVSKPTVSESSVNEHTYYNLPPVTPIEPVEHDFYNYPPIPLIEPPDHIYYTFPSLTPSNLEEEVYVTPNEFHVMTYENAVIYQSPAASSGPICRICHEGDSKEDLLSPCLCTGTVGLVHKSCMERWLTTRNDRIDKCEICNYTFTTARSPKSIWEWFRSEEDPARRRSILGDIVCFIFLTPLALVSSYLCYEGSRRQVIANNRAEAGCLMALSTFLITIYSLWNILTVRYHVVNCIRWRLKNQNVKLLNVRRVSAQLNSIQAEPENEANIIV